MTIRCLSQEEKNVVIAYYKTKEHNQKTLATYAGVSERTINRVLIEAGLATPVARIQGEAHQVMQLVKAYGLSYQGLKNVLEAQYVRAA